MPSSTRRHFLQSTATAGLLGFFPGHGHRTAAASSPNERPVFATIGLRNQGWAITNKTLRFADFVALADVDANVLGTVVEKCARKQSQGRMPILGSKPWWRKPRRHRPKSASIWF